MKAIVAKNWSTPYQNDVFTGPVKHFSYGKLSAVLKLAKNESKETAVDLGCGMGYFLPSLSNYFKRVIAVDEERIIGDSLDENQVFVDKEFWNPKYLNKSFFTVVHDFLSSQGLENKVQVLKSKDNKVEVEDNSCDVIFSLDVLEHVKERERFLQEVNRVLKKEGAFIYSVPNTKGLMFFVRKIAGLILGVKEDPSTQDHENYNWKEDLDLIRIHFDIEKVKGFPFFLPHISPSILIRCRCKK